MSEAKNIPENKTKTDQISEKVPEGAKELEIDENTGLPKGFGSPGASGDPSAALPNREFDPSEKPSAEETTNRCDIPQEILSMEKFLPQGLTVEMVWEFKKQYGNVYVVEVCDQIYLYRAMSKPEYKSIMNLEGATREMQEEKIAEKCVLFPALSMQNLRMGLAGLATTLAEYIMRASGFGAMSTPTKI